MRRVFQNGNIEFTNCNYIIRSQPERNEKQIETTTRRRRRRQFDDRINRRRYTELANGERNKTRHKISNRQQQTQITFNYRTIANDIFVLLSTTMTIHHIVVLSSWPPVLGSRIFRCEYLFVVWCCQSSWSRSRTATNFIFGSTFMRFLLEILSRHQTCSSCITSESIYYHFLRTYCLQCGSHYLLLVHTYSRTRATIEQLDTAKIK